MFDALLSNGTLISVAADSKDYAWQMAEYTAYKTGVKVVSVYPEGYQEPSTSLWSKIMSALRGE